MSADNEVIHPAFRQGRETTAVARIILMTFVLLKARRAHAPTTGGRFEEFPMSWQTDACDTYELRPA